jgi:hypothetical protein
MQQATEGNAATLRDETLAAIMSALSSAHQLLLRWYLDSTPPQGLTFKEVIKAVAAKEEHEAVLPRNLRTPEPEQPQKPELVPGYRLNHQGMSDDDLIKALWARYGSVNRVQIALGAKRRKSADEVRAILARNGIAVETSERRGGGRRGAGRPRRAPVTPDTPTETPPEVEMRLRVIRASAIGHSAERISDLWAIPLETVQEMALDHAAQIDMAKTFSGETQSQYIEGLRISLSKGSSVRPGMAALMQEAQ